MRRKDRIFHDPARHKETTGRGLKRRRKEKERRENQLTFRRRRSVNVAAAIAAPPEELTGRPGLRLNIVGAIVLTLFGVLVLRLWALQVIDHSAYDAAVHASVVRTVTVPAPRGLITARTGTVLAGNQVQYQIVLSRVTATQNPSIIGSVAALIGEPPKQVQAAITDSQYSPYEPVPVLTGATTATVDYLEEHRSEFPGVAVQQITERTYPAGGTVATPILGYVSAINATELKAHSTGKYTQAAQYGQTGLENQYQRTLAGVPGTNRLLVNAAGQTVGTLHKANSVQGDTIVTNIDLGLEHAVTAALQADILTDRKTTDPTTKKKPAAVSGAEIVMNVQTGAVLALASNPTYNLSDWLGGITEANYTSLESSGALYNYATQGLYTPGSSFKLASATAALQAGVINPTVPYQDSGTFKIPNCKEGCTFHDNAPSDAGTITLPYALTESDDDYFYNIGYQFYANEAHDGPIPIQDVAGQYGLGVLTGIDLPAEVQGRVDSPTLRKKQHDQTPATYPYDNWYAGTNLEMAFGQGETDVTPIEMAQAYATFANGGTRYQPEVAAEIVKANGTGVKVVPPKVTGHVVLGPSIMGPMLAGFEGVVATKAGTATTTFHKYATFSLTQFRIAGKTGTADISSKGEKEPDSWFIAFGPEPNPTYVVAVAIGQGGYGAAAAAPAVVNTFNYLVAHPPPPIVTPTPTVKSVPTTTTTALKGSSTTSGKAHRTRAPTQPGQKARP